MVRHRIGLDAFTAFFAVVAIGCSQSVVEQGARPDDTAGTLTAQTPGLLTIGSAAPPLDIEHWVHNGEGRFQPVTSFVEGKVYVVEFWATWCGPCLHSIPHLSQLQRQYADQGVTLVSISDEPLDTVAGFVDRELHDFVYESIDPNQDTEENGDESAVVKPTYGEFTKHYCLTTDPDGSAKLDYMQAARQRGIPTAFIVGKTGKIEWIGHPIQIDQPLKQVVAGAWDRDAFGSGFRLVQELRVRHEQASLAADEGDVERAREIGASMMRLSKLPDIKRRAAMMVQRVERKIFRDYLENDQDKAAKQLPRIVELLDGDAQAINQVTWGIVKIAEAGKPVSDKLLQLSADITNAALSPTEPEGSLLDTIAHCYYHLGDLDRAIAYQQRAVKGGNEGQLQQEIEDYLAKLLSEQQQADPAGDET